MTFVKTALFHKAGEGSGGGGGGGGDQHNLGWYATQSALETAHPTAEDGDWAIVGSTDTVWVWDSDNNEWKDTDQKGQVESVNGQTGTVVLTASDVGAATTAQGAKADTAVQPGDLATVATTGAYSDLSGTPTIPAPMQVSTLPTAGADELGNIYQFIGTTDANYTNGYFYKCVSDGQDPATYSWEQTDVMPAGSSLPSQTGQSGKFLTTDGTNASWSDKPLVNKATGNRALCIGNASSSGNFSIVIDQVGGSSTADAAINIGTMTQQNAKNLLIGASKANMPMGCVFLNAANAPMYTNFGIGEFWVGVSNTQYGLYYKVMDVSGHIPTDRLTKVNSTITLTAAGWSSNTQTVSVTGVTADGVVMVSPAPTDQSAYTSAGILCTAQAAGSLSFTCDTVPASDLSVNIVML